MKILKCFFVIALSFSSFDSYSQDFVEKNTQLESFVQNKYKTDPFEGVKIIEGDVVSYLISLAIVNTSSHKTQSSMNRVASIKARRNALIFLQGSTLTSESILKTSEKVSSNSVSYYENFIDKITENSSGFVDGMSTLTSFKTNNAKEFVYVLYKALE